jgi:hypothetical protein
VRSTSLRPSPAAGVTQTSRGSLDRVAIVLAFAAGLPAAAFFSRRVLVAVRRRFTCRTCNLQLLRA